MGGPSPEELKADAIRRAGLVKPPVADSDSGSDRDDIETRRRNAERMERRMQAKKLKVPNWNKSLNLAAASEWQKATCAACST